MYFLKYISKNHFLQFCGNVAADSDAVVCLNLTDRSFDDDDSVDGRSSSSFKVPKVPKKPAESSAARRPSATGGKLGMLFLFTLKTKCTIHPNRQNAICSKHVGL